MPNNRFRFSPALILLPLSSLIITALLGEALLRWVFHAAPLLDLDIYYLDAGRNLRMQPGIRRRHVTRQWDVSIAINQEGFRDRLNPILSPEPPVLALGDSFTFGWGVNLEDSYLYLLEEHLNRVHPVRVIKAGTNGTGTGDQFRLLEAIGDSYKPQMILLSFFVGNDFTDVQMGGLDQFDVKDGLLIRRELRPPSWTEALRQKLSRSSHLLQFLRAAQLGWQQRRAMQSGRQQGAVPGTATHAALASRDPWLLEFSKVHLRRYPEETARGVARTLEYLDAFHQYARKRGADFVIMVIPRSIQINPKELAEWQSAFQIADQDLDLDHPQKVLQDWAASRSVPLLDLLPEFRRFSADHPGQNLYYYPDTHLNRTGHKVTAELLAKFLERQGLPRRVPKSLTAPESKATLKK